MSENVIKINGPRSAIRIGAPGPQGIPGTGVSSVDWSAITGKPLTFTPDDHTHPILEVDGLTEALALKADGDAVDAQFAALEIDIAGKAALTHTHAIADVLTLQTALDGKAALSHTQSIGTITGLGSGVSTFLATPSSANLAAALTDEVGGSSVVFSDNPTFTTGIKIPDGTSSLPSIAWTSDSDGSGTGLYRSGTNRVGVSCNGNLTAQFLSGGIELPSGNQINFGTSVLLNAASNTLSIRNGLNPQTLQIFGTYATAGADYVRGSLSGSTTAFTIAAESGGTGSANLDIVLTPKGTGAVKLTSAKVKSASTNVATLEQTFVFETPSLFTGTTATFFFDNASRIGTSNTSLRLNVLTNTSVLGITASGLQIASTNFFGFSIDGNPTGTIDTTIKRGGGAGIITLGNNSTSFDRLQYGGTTNSFPCHKRRGATLECRLADDSAIATFVGAMVRKAGAVSDADFTNPVDGCHGFDTVNKKHYIREGGVWYSSPVYT